MPRRRNIEEEFHAIAPRGQRGIPVAPPIAVGVAGSTTSTSQASEEIARLEAQFRQQTSLVQSNLQANTSSPAGTSVGNVVEHSVGGGLGLLSPVISGLLSLFGIGGSKQEPAPLPFYTAPPSVQISDTLRSVAAPSSSAPVARNASTSAAPQITVQVSAMDSQSFMDRSGDIANAVREAMLNLHPINDVVANL